MFNYGDGTEHQDERMFFRTIEIFAALSFLLWYGKKIFSRPGLFLLGIILGAIAVWTCYLIPHGDWIFYPIALSSVVCFIKVGKRRQWASY